MFSIGELSKQTGVKVLKYLPFVTMRIRGYCKNQNAPEVTNGVTTKLVFNDYALLNMQENLVFSLKPSHH